MPARCGAPNASLSFWRYKFTRMMFMSVFTVVAFVSVWMGIAFPSVVSIPSDQTETEGQSTFGLSNFMLFLSLLRSGELFLSDIICCSPPPLEFYPSFFFAPFSPFTTPFVRCLGAMALGKQRNV